MKSSCKFFTFVFVSMLFFFSCSKEGASNTELALTETEEKENGKSLTEIGFKVHMPEDISNKKDNVSVSTIGNEEDAAKMLGFTLHGIAPEKGIISAKAYYDVFKAMKERFGFKIIATSLRESYSASQNGWQGLLYDGDNFYLSKKYEITIVDRLGGGDAFSAGLIYSLLTKKDLQTAIEIATSSSALKQTIPGDFNISSLEEVEHLLKGDGTGRVIR